MKRGFVHELKNLSRKEEISTLLSKDIEKRRERAVTTTAIVKVRRTFSPPLLCLRRIFSRHLGFEGKHQRMRIGVWLLFGLDIVRGREKLN